jgi:hypothetical protein
MAVAHTLPIAEEMEMDDKENDKKRKGGVGVLTLG